MIMEKVGTPEVKLKDREHNRQNCLQEQRLRYKLRTVLTPEQEGASSSMVFQNFYGLVTALCILLFSFLDRKAYSCCSIPIFLSN